MLSLQEHTMLLLALTTQSIVWIAVSNYLAAVVVGNEVLLLFWSTLVFFLRTVGFFDKVLLAIVDEIIRLAKQTKNIKSGSIPTCRNEAIQIQSFVFLFQW